MSASDLPHAAHATPYDKHFGYRPDYIDIAPRFFLRTRLMLDMLGRERGTVLDVGCGDGFFMRLLAEHGFSTVGIDVSTLATSLARRVLAAYPGCAVHCTTIEDFRPEAPFRLVTCGETLEHIEDDVAFLGQIHRLTAPGGTLILTVPINMKLWTDHDTRAGHYRRYAKSELFDKLERSGFHVEAYTVWGFPLVRLMHRHIREAQDRRIRPTAGSAHEHAPGAQTRSRQRDLLLKLRPLLRIAKYGVLFDNLFNFTERGVGIVVRARRAER